MTWSPDDPDAMGDDDAIIGLLLPAADTRSGPARRRARPALAEMYRSAVDEVLATREAPAPTLRAVLPSGARARRPLRWARVLAVAAALLLAVAAGSSASAVALRFFNVRLVGAELPAEAPPPRRAPATPDPIAPVSAPPAIEIEVPRPGAAPPPAPALRPRVRRVREVATVRPLAETPVVVPEDRPAEDLLALASERRVRHEWRAADQFYAAVERRFPGTDAAVVAAVASAALHLRHLGDAAGALAAYERALEWRPTGPLAEDARWGVVEVERSRGDARAEAQALRLFLARHPQSNLAPAARRRLDRLSP